VPAPGSTSAGHLPQIAPSQGIPIQRVVIRGASRMQGRSGRGT